MQENKIIFKNIKVVNTIGEALYLYDNSLIKFIGTNIFTGNFNSSLVASNPCKTKVVFDGNNTFSENQQPFSFDSSEVLFRGNTTISRNGNTAAAFYSSEVLFQGHTLICKNSAFYSVLFIRHSHISFYGITDYIDNEGRNNIDTLDGQLFFHGVNNFVNNRATAEGGAIFSAYGELSFANTTIFMNNSASMGGAINSIRGNTRLQGNCSFINNLAKTGGAI